MAVRQPRPLQLGSAHEVSFRDLWFNRELVKRQVEGRRPWWAWRYFGMPHIEREIANCVFYAVGPDPQTGEIKIGGSGFIVARASQDVAGARHYYAVTNSHVYSSSPMVRLNTKAGATRLIEMDQLDWLIQPGFDDVAVCDITDHLDLDSDQVSAVPEAGFLRETDEYFGMGDDVFMVGLFSNEPGAACNNPKARFGNVSAMASASESIRQPHGVQRPTHIVDMHSRTGFSGAPVFVYDTPHHLIFDDRYSLKLPTGDNLLRLLGIHCGQYHEVVRVQVESDDSTAEAGQRDWDFAPSTGDRLVLPSSMTQVVPAWRISELLDRPELGELRRRRDFERRDSFASFAQPEDL